MWPCQDRRSFANLAIHHRRGPLPGINVEFLSVAREDLHPPVSVPGGIDEDASAVVVRPEDIRNGANAQRALLDLQLGRSRAGLAVIRKPGERATATRPGEESQLPLPDDLEGLVPDPELAPLAPVVPAGAEAQVGPAALDVLRDAPVALAVERAAVPLVRAAGHDEERARRRPRLLEDHVARDGDHGVVGGQQAAERVEAVADRVHGGSIAWVVCRQRVVAPGGLGERTGVDQDVEPRRGDLGAVACCCRRHVPCCAAQAGMVLVCRM